MDNIILNIYHIDAFSKQPFRGNPAAVCVTELPLADLLMQNIAMEINLSETAFVHCINKEENLFSIQWFSPTTEVDLCGHATLAAAHILYEHSYASNDQIKFSANKNKTILSASKSEHGITLDFPVDRLEILEPKLAKGLLYALGLPYTCPVYRGQTTKQIIVEAPFEHSVLELEPNFESLLKLEGKFTGVAVTTKSHNFDFISRFFDPWEGINEDPVTGSAHTLLAPYWANQLNKKDLLAKQESPRGGEIVLQLEGDRVYISGAAVTVYCCEMIL